MLVWFSPTTVLLVCVYRTVPPTAVTYGDEAGLWTIGTPLFWMPLRAMTAAHDPPVSPGALNMVRPSSVNARSTLSVVTCPPRATCRNSHPPYDALPMAGPLLSLDHACQVAMMLASLRS